METEVCKIMDHQQEIKSLLEDLKLYFFDRGREVSPSTGQFVWWSESHRDYHQRIEEALQIFDEPPSTEEDDFNG